MVAQRLLLLVVLFREAEVTCCGFRKSNMNPFLRIRHCRIQNFRPVLSICTAFQKEVFTDGIGARLAVQEVHLNDGKLPCPYQR